MDALATIPQNPIAEIEQFQTVINNFAAECTAYVVTRQTLEGAEEKAKQARQIEKAIEDRRKEIKEPYLKMGKMIDEAAKKTIKNLSAASDGIRKQILAVKTEIEAERIAEQRRLDEERKKLEELLKKDEVKVADVVKLAQVQQAQAEIKTEKSNGIRKTWDFRIADENLLPREFLMPNESAIRQAVIAGAREIPGVKVFQKETLVIR